MFTAATFAVIALTAQRADRPRNWSQQALKTAAVLALAQVGYCGLFGLLGLLMRRSLLVGVAYIVLFEGILASFDTVARRLTIMYYFRVLVLRWLDPARREGLVDRPGHGAGCADLRADAAGRRPGPGRGGGILLCRQRVPHEDARGQLRRILGFGPIGLGERVRRNTLIIQFQVWLLVMGDSLLNVTIQLLIELLHHWVERELACIFLADYRKNIDGGLLRNAVRS